MYIVQEYIFIPGEAGAGTIEIPAILKLEDFGTIINVSKGSILYDPAEGNAGATVSHAAGATTLTLEQSTTYCQSTNEIQIQVLGGGDASVSEVRVVNTALDPVAVSGKVNTLSGLDIPEHDFIELSYTDNNMTGVVYKMGGSSGATVATLVLTYDGDNNLTSVTKS